ncbi:MAG: hypothetical protein WAV45_03160 [Propionibacteriaceae bacterium]
MTLELALTLVSGVAWSVVYVAAIRIGFRDRTYAMPFGALALNLAWEFLYTYDGFTSPWGAQTWVNLVWACLDVVILASYLRFGRRDLPSFVTRPMFGVWVVGMLGVAFAVQGLFIAEFGWSLKAAEYSAFLQNLLMSVLFVQFYVLRGGPRGQSLVIAVAKWLGTLAPTILLGVLPGNVFVIGIGALCSVVDLAYIALLLWGRRGPSAGSMRTV